MLKARSLKHTAQPVLWRTSGEGNTLRGTCVVCKGAIERQVEQFEWMHSAITAEDLVRLAGPVFRCDTPATATR